VAIVDPLAAQLTAIGRQMAGNSSDDLPLFFALPGVIPPALAQEAQFSRALGEAYDLIAARGALAAVTAAPGSWTGRPDRVSR
jgi:hypothetical protein